MVSNTLSHTALCLLTIFYHAARIDGYDCTGSNLSPIKIDNLTEIYSLPDLIHTEPYDIQPNSINVLKHPTGLFRLTPAYNPLSRPKIVGGPLRNPYILQHIDFHWGEHDSVGSEHIYEDLRFPMEIQAVYYNEKYANMAQAMRNTNGIAVVTYFAIISPDPNDAFTRVVQKHHDLSYPGLRSADLTTKFSMSQLLPRFTDEYVTYNGAYNKYNENVCAYTVDWIIQPQPIPISKGQMSLFRGLAKNTPAFLNNYAQITPRNNRIIYYQREYQLHERGFECTGDALSPIRISEYSETDKFPDFIQTDAHDTEPSTIRVTKSDVGFFRVEPAYTNVKFWPMVIGGPLEYFYRLQHIDIHWGESNAVGSEHIIGDTQYPMEVQAVYYNDKYANLIEAISKDDGLAIVSYLVNVTDTPNDGISRLVGQHNHLLPAGVRSALLTTKFAMSDLLKYFSDRYYTYKGSYSKRDYKPCAYNVQWIIRKEPIGVSEGQINLFRELAANSPALLNTFANEEPINDRTVYYQDKCRESVTCGCITTALHEL